MPKTARHKATQAKYDKKRRAKATANGFCGRCRKREAAKNKKQCVNCLQRLKEMNRKKYEEAKAKGLCTRCYKKKTVKGKTKCVRCLNSQKQSSKKRREVSKAQDNVCVRCHKQKPESEFISLQNRCEEKTSVCRPCRDKQHDYQNSDRSAVGRQEKKFNAIRAQEQCSVCREDDPDVLEADHVIGKKVKPLSDHKYWCNKPVKFAKELTKIDWKCAFHHRLKTQRDWKIQTEQKKPQKIAPSRIRMRLIIKNYKLKQGKCKHCERVITPENCVAFDFNHKDPQTKRYTISNMPMKPEKEFNEKFEPEAEKCEIVCANCHKKITDKQNKNKRN